MLRSVVGLVVVTACMLALPALADVYKSVDDKGNVQYTDVPDKLPAQLVERIKSQRTDDAAVSDRTAAEQQQYSDADAQRAKTDDQKKAQKSDAADKADRCKKARERYDQLMTAQQVYTTNDKGERVNMDDKQVEQARASAKQMMDTWCN